MSEYLSLLSFVSLSPIDDSDVISDISSLENDSIEVVGSSFITLPLPDDQQMLRSIPLLPHIGSVIWPSVPKKKESD
jgi:hypothetical protein